MATNREPCLSTGGWTSSDENEQKTFSLNLQRQGNDSISSRLVKWSELRSDPTISAIVVHGGSIIFNDVGTESLMTDLALNLNTNNNAVRKIEFHNCRVEQLAHLCVAMTTTTTTTTTASTSNEPVPSMLIQLEFHGCSLESPAAKTLKFMLESQRISELLFVNCTFDSGIASVIAQGLSLNKSLRKFHCLCNDDAGDDYDDDDEEEEEMDEDEHERKRQLRRLLRQRSTPLGGLPQMLKTNPKLVDLSFSVSSNGGSDFWKAFQSSIYNQSLQVLTISHTTVQVSMMEMILMKCFTIPSLQKLSFQRCTIVQSAMHLLHQSLSKYQNVIHTLEITNSFVNNTPGDNNDNDDDDDEFSLGSLQVHHLKVEGTSFLSWSKFTNHLANNTCMQSLHLDNTDNDDRDGSKIQKLCEDVLRHDRGPSQLTIENVVSAADHLARVLPHNTTLHTLTMDVYRESDLVAFAQSLASTNTTGLRKLSIHFVSGTSNEEQRFLDALAESLEHNTSLITLKLGTFLDLSEPCMRKIRYYLAMNRIGRHTLIAKAAESAFAVPMGIWSHVLAKSSEEAMAIYFILREKPDIIITPSRKRKHPW